MGEGRRCPVVIGRGGQVDELRAAVDVLADEGRGSAVLLTGEAGIGKSRLARETTAYAGSRGLAATWGRASENSTPDPFRPLVELVSAALRRLGDRGTPELDSCRPVLARLVPTAGPRPSPEASPAVLADALLRLLSTVGGVAVIEDLHWAGPDTLAVVEYLADHAVDAAFVLVGTARTEEASPSAALTRTLARRRAVSVVELRRLDDEAVVRMAAACLDLEDGQQLPPAMVELLVRSADGVPLLVEDVLNAAERSGHLVAGLDGWETTTGLRPQVPVTFTDTVLQRMVALDGNAVRVVSAAALFGPRFPWELLGAVTGLDDDDVLDALRAATNAGLVMAENDGMAFRHALTAAAVLDGLLPPERARLSGRAATAIEANHADLPGPWSVMVADLRVAAGDPGEAARLLLSAGRDALANGAVAGAVSILDRAFGLAADDCELEVGVTLLQALVEAGEVARAEQLGRQLLAIRADAPSDTDVDVRLLLARVNIGTDRGAALGHLDRARAVAEPGTASRARVDALAARLALESDSPRRIQEARQLAERALGVTAGPGLAEVRCDALEVIGRSARVADLDAAENAFGRQLETARAAGLELWRIRALYELGTIDLLRRLDPARLQRARDAALEAGAIVLAAGYEVNLAVYNLQAGHNEIAVEVARSCETTARRLGLAPLVSAALVFQAVAASCEGRRSQAEALIEQAGGAASGDLAVWVWGVCRALLALLDEDRPAALAAFERAAEADRRAPALTTDPFSGEWLLLRLVEGTAGEDDLGALDRLVPGSLFHRVTEGAARAVVLGRAGRGEEATAAFAAANAVTEGFPLYRHLHLRLVGEAAFVDGWGDPAAWLLEAESWFGAIGHRQVSTACRRLLRGAGVVVGRGGVAEAEVPASLRRCGVTAREAEVLALVAERMTNREIAERLYLSPRTVEKHVAGLLTKLGASSRVELGRRWGSNG